MKTIVKNDTLPKTGRVLYLDLLKTVAIIGVLIIHITSQAFTLYTPFSFNYNFSVFISCTARFSVPIFVMASGALFLNENKQISVSQIFKVYILRIVTALTIFALFYECIPVLFTFIKTGIVEKQLIYNAISNIVNLNTHFHLYYLYIIILIYMLVPPIKIFLKSAERKNIEYLLLFLFAFSILMPLLKSIYPFRLFSGGMTNQYMINLTYGMLTYFILGHYLNKYELSKKAEITIFTLGVISVLFTFFATAFESYITSQFSGRYIEAMTPNVFFMASALFLSIKKISKKVKDTKGFVFISKASFLIYLIHDFYNIIFRESGLSMLTFSPVFSIPLMLILVFGFSILTYLILRKIPLINKIL